jgi:TfoX/Sxy family transcriptional regulator of competence genes
MPFDEHLADRVRTLLKEKKVKAQEKRMMGGLCFMVKDKMCVGIVNDSLMARVGAESHASALKKKGCREMDFTGRPMKGFVFVGPSGIDLETELEYWIDLSLAYNPKAKSSKK